MLKSLAPNSSIAVLGSGISGLTFSFFLNRLRPDVNIHIFEKSKQVGGWIRSEEHKTFHFEKGPRTLRGTNTGTLMLLDLLTKIGANEKVLGLHKDSLANKKYLLAPFSDVHGNNAKLLQVPQDFSSFVKFMFDPLSKDLIFGLLKEPWQPKLNYSDESVDHFFNRRFATKLSENIVSAIVHGIYAGDVKKLSVKAVFPRLPEMEQESGSIIRYMIAQYRTRKNVKQKVDPFLTDYENLIGTSLSFKNVSLFLKNFPMLSFRGGLQKLPISLKNHLSQIENIKFHFDSKIKNIALESGKVALTDHDQVYLVDHVRSTINTNELAKIISPVVPSSSTKKSVFKSKANGPELVKCLSWLHYTNILMCNIYIPKHVSKSITGFGYLVPRSMSSQASKLLGVIFDSDMETAMTPNFAEANITAINSNSASPKQLQKFSDQFVNNDLPKYTKLTLMLGGHYLKSEADMPGSAESKHAVKAILSNHLNIDLDEFASLPDFKMEITKIPNCIPQYEVGYLDLKRKVQNAASKEFNDQISFGGMAFGDGVGIPDCVQNAFKDSATLSGI
ncbi:hypothetical protein LJB42_000871 [Komagataella kurtzmanii]|nr:hypothetical protein LJB42_000871 [Komagataella kurtzmanii]